jgi:threonyl-tRNA synthetase
MSMPERFGLEYVDEHGVKQRPVMIHRALIGSPDRFMGIFIEHTAGNFPVWMAPEQVRILPVSTDKHLDGARALEHELSVAGIRVDVDAADETVGKKIRNSSKDKVPYVLVIGDKELSEDILTIRIRGVEEQVEMTKNAFVEKIKHEIQTRKS